MGGAGSAQKRWGQVGVAFHRATNGFRRYGIQTTGGRQGTSALPPRRARLPGHIACLWRAWCEQTGNRDEEGKRRTQKVRQMRRMRTPSIRFTPRVVRAACSAVPVTATPRPPAEEYPYPSGVPAKRIRKISNSLKHTCGCLFCLFRLLYGKRKFRAKGGTAPAIDAPVV